MYEAKRRGGSAGHGAARRLALASTMVMLAGLSACGGGGGGDPAPAPPPPPPAPSASAPTLTQQPQSVAVDAGQTATFTVVATGTAPLAYEWRRNDVVIPGATAASYTTPALTAGDSGALYTVRVSNAAGTVTSASAALTVRSVAGTPGAERLSMGTYHVVALRADGSALAWGGNPNGQLGGGAVLAGSPARQVAVSATAVAAGAFESLALGGDGVVRGWGNRQNLTILGGTIPGLGALGIDMPTPTTGTWPTGITRLVIGTGNSFAFGLRSDGTVWHMPGTVTTSGTTSTQNARQVPGLTGVTRLGAGVVGSPTAILADGSVVRITLTNSGGFNWQAAAVPVPGVSGATASVCNAVGCMALTSAGVVSFPDGGVGTPQAVTGLPAVARIAAGGTFFLAVGTDGSLWRWNLGSTPAAVPGAANVVEAVSNATSTVLVRLSDGTVWGYGPNTFNELGSSGAAATLVRVPGIALN